MLQMCNCLAFYIALSLRGEQGAFGYSLPLGCCRTHVLGLPHDNMS